MSKVISQIIIRDSDDPIPTSVNQAILSIRNCFNDFTYTLYNKEKIIEFIKEGFGDDTLKAFHKLKPYAYKADLARYCIAYLKGGLYADISIRMVGKVKIPEHCEFLSFKSWPRHTKYLPYHIENSLFYTKPRNKIFKKAIEIVIENCRNEFYGVSTLCPTGPGVLGRAFAIFGMNRSNIMGECLHLTPYHQNTNRSFVLPDGTIFAFYKTAWNKEIKPGEIHSLGFRGVNNYALMYRNNDIYDKDIYLSSEGSIDIFK